MHYDTGRMIDEDDDDTAAAAAAAADAQRVDDAWMPDSWSAPTVLYGSSCPRVSGVAAKLTLDSDEVWKLLLD